MPPRRSQPKMEAAPIPEQETVVAQRCDVWSSGVADFSRRFAYGTDKGSMYESAHQTYFKQARPSDSKYTPVYDDDGNYLLTRHPENRGSQKQTRVEYKDWFLKNGYNDAPKLIFISGRTYQSSSGKTWTEQLVVSGAHRSESWDDAVQEMEAKGEYNMYTTELRTKGMKSADIQSLRESTPIDAIKFIVDRTNESNELGASKISPIEKLIKVIGI